MDWASDLQSGGIDGCASMERKSAGAKSRKGMKLKFPQRLKPNLFTNTYERAGARTLQKAEFSASSKV
jgi:hypothetical protein